LDSSFSIKGCNPDSLATFSFDPMTPTLDGVGVDGGVNDVSDDIEARAKRLFLRGVT
jgi:hypothetical protein